MHSGPNADRAFEHVQNQAQLVGSALFAFEQGVTTEVREAISDAALLAQLVANKKVDITSDPLGWFKEYSDVLTTLGWSLDTSSWTEDDSNGTASEVHEKILEVAAVVLGPIPTALAIVTATINALKKMDEKSSWLTIFNRESHKANVGRFQVGFVSTEDDAPVVVHLFAYLIEAQTNLTQVLFFKFRNQQARFRSLSNKVSINRASIKDLKEPIRNKVRAYQEHYLSSVLDVEVP